MKYIQKKTWPIWGMILLTLLLNVLIVIASDKNQNLLWLLVVFIPLFSILAYFAWQIVHLPQKSSADSAQPSAQHSNFEFLSHSVYPTKIALNDLKVQIGNDQCSQPYNACIFNIDSMENIDQGSIFSNAMLERNPECLGYSDVKGLDTYHLAEGGVVWQVGTEYVGCRTENGHFSSKEFKKNACRPEIKMIELKLSSARKRSDFVDSFLELAEPIDSQIVNRIFSTSAFTSFNDAEGMIHFLNNLRELSGGKPIGMRICINDKKEFYQICYAIRKTQLIPDFIVVEGSFETKDIVHSNQAFHIEMPLYEALMFVSQTLHIYGLENIKIIAASRIISCFDILKVIALGADMICTEMPHCHIMNYAENGGKLSLQFKSQNVYVFHNDLMNDTVQMMRICGFRSMSDITVSKLFSRLDVMQAEKFAKLNSHVLYPASVRKVFGMPIIEL